MMYELPEGFDIVRGSLGYSTMDTGDRYLVFGVEPEDFDWAKAGGIVGMIIPAGVGARYLDQVLGEIRDLGGVKFVIQPLTERPAES